jgi:putative ABC transport system permease protein
MRFVKIAWKNLTRRPLRSSLTVMGLAIAVAAAVVLVGIAQGFERSFLNLYSQRGGDLVVQHAGGVMQLSSSIDQKLGPRIQSLPGVRQVIGGLADLVALEQFDLFAVIVNGWDPDSRMLTDVTIVSGRRLYWGDRGRVMIGKLLADNTGRHVGDKIEIYAEQFEIIGIFESFSVYDSGAIFMLLDELQRLMDRPGQVTGYLVQATGLDDPQAVVELKKRIESLGPHISAITVPEFIHNYAHIRVARVSSWITSTIAVTIGVIGMLNTMIMSVFERTSEIGTLRAMGWRKSRVMWMVLCESALLSTSAAVVGVTLAILAVRVVRHWPPVAGFVEGNIPVSVIIGTFAAALLIGILGAAFPAYWAAQLWPVEAMRHK